MAERLDQVIKLDGNWESSGDGKERKVDASRKKWLSNWSLLSIEDMPSWPTRGREPITCAGTSYDMSPANVRQRPGCPSFPRLRGKFPEGKRRRTIMVLLAATLGSMTLIHSAAAATGDFRASSGNETFEQQSACLSACSVARPTGNTSSL